MDAPFMFTPWISEDFWKELREMSRLTYVFLNMLAHSHRQKPEIYTKDEINEMFYGACGEHERNKEAFQMKLDGVYYPLNDSISWLTTYMEEMKQDIARIQHEANVARPPSIDRRQPPSIDITPPTSIDRHHHTSIDNRLTASIDNSPPRPHTMKSQPDFHTREEINQLVEAIQGELVEIQSYIVRRPEASLSIDRRNNISTDIPNQTSVDNATNRGRLVPKMTSDMSNTHYHGKEISADTYAALTRHQFNLESLGERLQRIENTTAAMKDKWRRGDEAMRDFTEIYTKDEINEMFYGVCGEHERNKEAFQMKLDGVYYPLNDSISWLTTCMEEIKQDIARIQNATDTARPPSIDSRQPPSIDRHHHTSIDNRLTASIDNNPPRPDTMKSQPDFHTREEIDQLVEAIQGELVEIQSYIVRRPEAALSIDRRNNISTDIHNRTSVDNATNRGRLVPKMTSDMSNTPYHREEISADTYAALTRHQFNLESLGERL
ncbi:hypothetical protein DY000_02008208 [Brassica cretica]|uniref:Uncharacterized protein n=1 Tax=Brassica cretica TaxID=69181 RepID=A0ABQ7CA83_BRACR|nr:hypothetical protein DY000_02008208 [Brassica cretica]